jgi:2-polyprenyl-3-methyl-5-hydroxy-6-metoxy-1,4-benzoquinol methylase
VDRRRRGHATDDAIASHGEWEPLLLSQGYWFAHDDGLNRYHVAEEHDELVPAFRDPPAFAVTRAAETVALDTSLPDEQRFDPFAARFLDLSAPEPTLATPMSQLCTEGQFRERLYAHWTRAFHETPVAHRKQWEFVYLLQVLEVAGMLAPGRRGLGFGCGREPLAALMASRGCDVLATDLDAATAAGHGWIETDQHAARLEDLNDRGICPADVFAQRAQYRAVDMNAIPDDLKEFDFVWSSCAFEHLGSLEHGLAFVRRAMRCLRPGGIAVHTTEFNLSSNLRTLESPDLSVFRRQDIERLFRQLEAEGHARTRDAARSTAMSTCRRIVRSRTSSCGWTLM